MILIDNNEHRVFECSQAEASRMIGYSTVMLWHWKKERVKQIGRYTLIFDDVVRIKQKKGFALTTLIK